MKTKLFPIMVILWIIPTLLKAQIKENYKPCIMCEQLKLINLPDVTIVEAKDTEEGHCLVLGRISKEINFELLLPENWNHRFLMGGGGGFVGSIDNQFRYSVNLGFATVGTDAGHSGYVLSADWALNNMERQLNFGRLAVHRTATVAKAIIKIYYCSDPLFSYFLGVSRGGGQGLIEAQLYPDDFNGIVVIAPAISWPAFAAKFVQNAQKIYPDPKNPGYHIITEDNLALLQHYVLEQCDELDGLKDSIISNPMECDFDFSVIPVCPDQKCSPNCLTNRQIDAIKTICSPLIVNQDTIYPGFTLGAVDAKYSWGMWITGSDTSWQTLSLQYIFGSETFKYLVFNDPKWDYSDYNFSNYFKDTEYASSYLDATQTDYSEFKKAEGKMILAHGWNDPAQSAFSTINHFRSIEKNDRDLKSYIRLFMLPGVLHWADSPGPDQADWIQLITNWVEKNEAPERIVVSKVRDNKVVMTRPVYPFPKKVTYDGKGDPRLESSFKLINN